ncbi:hypothetical protein [Pelagibius sp.]|uniref:hypothetical protein n=1 Tax=Pelagibius sp. TaxID=1931238 RepID=UPI00261844A6|nr:hypothetical protein [Pelagibius sp.]
MEHIRGIGKLKKYSQSLTLSQFRILRRLVLEHEGLSATVYCKLCTDHFDPPLAIDLKFDGVKSFKTQELGGGQSTIDGFDVIDISSKGWERINWQAMDYEDGLVHWYAEEFEILDVAPL